MLELIINLQLRQMCVVPVQAQQPPVACYPIAVGRTPDLTPKGKFEIKRVVKDPSFVSCKNGKNYGKGFLGDFAFVTDRETSPGCSFAIHGTNREDLIGEAVSDGCARAKNRDIRHIEQNFLPYLTGGYVK